MPKQRVTEKQKANLKPGNKGADKDAKARLRLSIFLDPSSPGFLHISKSAELAGYAPSNTYGRWHKWARPHIQKWLGEEGLTDECLKLKLLQLLEAKETKFFAHEGRVVEKHDVDALGIQVQALALGIKVLGMNAPEKVEHSGTVTHQHELSPALKEMMDAVYTG